MSPSNIPSHLPAYLSSPATQRDAAVDALEEWILYRRAKGDTLFEVSVGLAEIESKVRPPWPNTRGECEANARHPLTPAPSSTGLAMSQMYPNHTT